MKVEYKKICESCVHYDAGRKMALPHRDYTGRIYRCELANDKRPCHYGHDGSRGK